MFELFEQFRFLTELTFNIIDLLLLLIDKIMINDYLRFINFSGIDLFDFELIIFYSRVMFINDSIELLFYDIELLLQFIFENELILVFIVKVI